MLNSGNISDILYFLLIWILVGMQDHSDNVFLFLILILPGLSIVSWLWGKRQAGSLVVTLGRRKLVARLFVVLGIGLILSAAFVYFGDPNRYRVCFFLLLGIYMILHGLNKPEIREKGIWDHWELVKWEQIKSYTWTADARYNLTLNTRKPRRFGKRLSSGGQSLYLAIPPHHKETVDRLLKEHLPSVSS